MSLHLRAVLLGALFAMLLAPAAASARTINVSPGADLARTLSEASAGDVIVLAGGGTYGHVNTAASFERGPDVIVQAKADETVVTEGWHFRRGASHIVLRGLTIEEPNFTSSSEGSAVGIDPEASDIAIEDCKLLEGRDGLFLGSHSRTDDDTTPKNITLSDSEIAGNGTNEGIQIDGVNIGAGYNIKIDHNVIHDIHIGLTDPITRTVFHDDGIQVFRAERVAITRNRIYQTTAGSTGDNAGIIVGRSVGLEESRQDVKDVTIEDNLTYQWPGSGITVAGATRVEVIHNTSYDSGPGNGTSLAISEPFGGNSELTVANNILEKLQTISGARNASICTTNLIASYDPRENTGGCSGTREEAPLFESTYSPYYLQSGSPASGAANESHPVAEGLGDLDETIRPARGADIGARERHLLDDTFVGTSGDLSAHVGEAGLAWSLDRADPGTADLSHDTVVAHAAGTTYSYTASWTPPDNSYAVEALMVFRNPAAGEFSGPVCRWSESGSKNGYMARIREGNVELIKWVSGTSTMLVSRELPASYYVGQPLSLRLECGPTKSVYLDRAASPIVTSNDNAVTQVGKAGVRGNSQLLPIDTLDAYDI